MYGDTLGRQRSLQGHVRRDRHLSWPLRSGALCHPCIPPIPGSRRLPSLTNFCWEVQIQHHVAFFDSNHGGVKFV